MKLQQYKALIASSEIGNIFVIQPAATATGEKKRWNLYHSESKTFYNSKRSDGPRRFSTPEAALNVVKAIGVDSAVLR